MIGIGVSVFIVMVIIISLFLINRSQTDTVDGFDENVLDDGIFLMQHETEGFFGCFGCGKTICVDPVAEMKQVQETQERYCTEDLEIVEKGKIVDTDFKDSTEHENPFVSDNKDKTIFYENENMFIKHHWPNSNYLGGDESEIWVYNKGDIDIEIKNPDMIYKIHDTSYYQDSGTWEKFPTYTSIDYTDYINIKPGIYQGEPLIIIPGEKAKIHYHYEFDQTLDDKEQRVQIMLTYVINDIEENIDIELIRDLSESPQESGNDFGH